MSYNRKNTKVVKAGNVLIGGNNPVVIQSMCNTDTHDIVSTVKQIKELEETLRALNVQNSNITKLLNQNLYSVHI